MDGSETEINQLQQQVDNLEQQLAQQQPLPGQADPIVLLHEILAHQRDVSERALLREQEASQVQDLKDLLIVVASILETFGVVITGLDYYWSFTAGLVLFSLSIAALIFSLFAKIIRKCRCVC